MVQLREVTIDYAPEVSIPAVQELGGIVQTGTRWSSITRRMSSMHIGRGEGVADQGDLLEVSQGSRGQISSPASFIMRENPW